MNGNNKIENAIERIEPRDGAKERMLANIKRKAAEQDREAPAAKRKTFADIAKWALPAAACLVIAVVGIKVIPTLTASESSPISSDVLVGSPFETVNSADEFEKRLGIAIAAPGGASEVQYTIIDGNIAEVYFLYGKNAYSLRASEQSGDFSGLYGVETAAEQLDSANNAVLTTIRDGGQTFLKLTWTDGKVNYILSDTDGGNEDEIKEIYGLVK